MKIIAVNKKDYLAQLGGRAQDIQAVDQMIRETAPDLEPAITGGMYGNMLAYGMMRYKPKSSNKEVEWPVLMLGAQKKHFAIYACALIDDQYIADRYKDDLGKVSVGKSCIRFKKFEDLDREGLIKMLKDLNTRYKKGEKLYGA